MFGIVKTNYLTGLDVDGVGQLANGIGGRMGINFEPDAVAYFLRDTAAILCLLENQL